MPTWPLRRAETDPVAQVSTDQVPDTFDLVRSFTVAAAIVVLVGMGAVGGWVSSRIEAAALRKSAVMAALYVEGNVGPPARALLTDEDPGAARAALNAMVPPGLISSSSFGLKIWNLSGVAVYASEPLAAGTEVDAEALSVVTSGEVYMDLMARGGDLASGLPQGQPVLEVYSPVRDPRTGAVIGVIEFYDQAVNLQAELDNARLQTWGVVGLVSSLMLLILSRVILRGGRLITAQRSALRDQVTQLSDLLAENRRLTTRADRANRRAADLNERYLRRISAEIHDGPVQLLAFATLRLGDRASVGGPRTEAIAAIGEAIAELRQISTGLTLPQLEGLSTAAVVERAVRAHESRSDRQVELVLPAALPDLSHPANICLYRVVQEALNNASRHAPGSVSQVRVSQTPETVNVIIRDDGPGFQYEPDQHVGLGLSGLRERVMGLGGSFELRSAPGEGTAITVRLPRETA